MFSMSLSIPGQYTERRALCFVLIDPWRLLRTIQYRFHESGNCEQCGGNPLIINCLDCWYSASSLAALRSISRWGLHCIVVVVALISEIEGSGWLRMSTSASMSWDAGSDIGCLDSTSDGLLLLPLSHTVIKL